MVLIGIHLHTHLKSNTNNYTHEKSDLRPGGNAGWIY
jgi:hypothetical protein